MDPVNIGKLFGLRSHTTLDHVYLDIRVHKFRIPAAVNAYELKVLLRLWVWHQDHSVQGSPSGLGPDIELFRVVFERKVTKNVKQHTG